MGLSVTTATDIVKFMIFLVALIIIIGFAIWFLDTLGTWKTVSSIIMNAVK